MRASQRGAVTAEAMAVLPVLVAVTIGCAWVVSLGLAELRVTDAACEAARLAARGDSTSIVVRRAEQIAPEGAVVSVEPSGDQIRVQVQAEVAAPVGLLGFLPAPTVRAEAISQREDA